MLYFIHLLVQYYTSLTNDIDWKANIVNKPTQIGLTTGIIMSAAVIVMVLLFPMAFAADDNNSSITNTNQCGVAKRDDLLLRAIRWQVNWMNDTTQPDPAVGDLLQNGKQLTTDMMMFLRDCVKPSDNVHIEMMQSFATMIDRQLDQNEVPSCGTEGQLCKPFKKIPLPTVK